MQLPSISHRAGSARPRSLLVASVFLASLVLPIANSAVACATGHGRPFLTGFQGGFEAASAFYSAPEGQPATATIGVTPGHCQPQPGSTASYRTVDAAATAPADYDAISPTNSDMLCADVDGPGQEAIDCPAGYKTHQNVSIPTKNNAGDEAAVEPFVFELTSASPFGLSTPSSASVHIVDVDGSPRASMEPSLTGGRMSYSRLEFGSVLIPVFRAGTGTSGDVHFTVSPDPARPATPGADFNIATPSPLQFGGGERMKFIRIDIVGDRLGEGDESLIIELQGGGSLAPADPSTATFTIIDNEENVFPVSRFHHPRHKLRYKRGDYRIREVHVFATDEGGSGVVGAEMALRRNLKNGTCAWFTRKGWKKDDCRDRRWHPMQFNRVADLFYYRLNALKSSVGKGRIKDYTAFSRAIDGAENVEKQFDERRNANTFEVKKKRRKR